MGCSTKKGGARKGKPKGSRLAYDDTEAIKSDRELKPIKTRVRKTKKGIRKVPRRKETTWVRMDKSGDWKGDTMVSKGERIDEGILRLIQTHHRTDNVIQAIERLILGKYK